VIVNEALFHSKHKEAAGTLVGLDGMVATLWGCWPQAATDRDGNCLLPVLAGFCTKAQVVVAGCRLKLW
jgi:hypothetical protein